LGNSLRGISEELLKRKLKEEVEGFEDYG